MLGSKLIKTISGWKTRAQQLLHDPLGMSQFDVIIEDVGLGALPLIGHTPIEQAASLLARAHSVLIFMGSGFSEESGLSTFRAKDTGLYQQDLIRVTHAETFEEEADWQLTWHERWLEEILKAKPNPGHHVVARLAQRQRITLATQNVDLLLEHALQGCAKHPPVHHVHGRLDKTRCHDHRCDLSGYDVDWRMERTCPVCGGRLRPDVIWFGEQLPQETLELIAQAAMSAEVCVLIGTSGLVYPAAALPELAKRSGARLIEINPHESSLSDLCDVAIRERSSIALQAIEAQLRADAQTQ